MGRSEIQHFILTRFNLLLWNKAKDGQKVRTTQWLEHRFSLFEYYCLPSIKNQTCQDFEWIILFDSLTPDIFKQKIAGFQKECSQLIPVFVAPEKGRCFAEIFRREMIKRLSAKKVISTYLDNDDALNLLFVEDLRLRACEIKDGTFVFYDDGYQYFKEDKYMMQLSFPKNHFVSVLEGGDPDTLKGIYGYGSHYYINLIEGAIIEHVKGMRMWCEVVHEKNVMNDAKFLNSKMIKGQNVLKNDFAINAEVDYGPSLYLFNFLPRYIKMFARRIKEHFFNKK